MNIEAKKLRIIERFMKIEQAQTIQKLDELLTEIEINARADLSQKDIEQGKTKSYDTFSKEVEEWMSNRPIK